MSGKIEGMGKKIKTYLFILLMVFVAVGMAISMIQKSDDAVSSDTVNTKQVVSEKQGKGAVSTPKDLEQSQRKQIMAKILSQLSPKELAVLNGNASQDKTDFTAYIEMNIKSALEYIQKKTKNMDKKEYEEFMKSEFGVSDNKK